MQLIEAIKLIQHKDIPQAEPQTWADLGCGSGLFTQALASLLNNNSTIYAVDKSIRAFKRFATTVSIELIQLDFIKANLNLSDLDGVIMANSLHFVKDKFPFIDKISAIISKGGQLLIVEYDTDTPNPWVPYPVSFSALKQLFKEEKYGSITKLHQQPSAFGRANIYSTVVKL